MVTTNKSQGKAPAPRAQEQAPETVQEEERPRRIIYLGKTEEERRVQSLIYDRLQNILERFGQSFTVAEAQTIQYVQRERVAFEEIEEEAGE
jgi:hypothetical protein